MIGVFWVLAGVGVLLLGGGLGLAACIRAVNPKPTQPATRPARIRRVDGPL